MNDATSSSRELMVLQELYGGSWNGVTRGPNANLFSRWKSRMTSRYKLARRAASIRMYDEYNKKRKSIARNLGWRKRARQRWRTINCSYYRRTAFCQLYVREIIATNVNRNKTKAPQWNYNFPEDSATTYFILFYAGRGLWISRIQ